jgi:hypothetical protein
MKTPVLSVSGFCFLAEFFIQDRIAGIQMDVSRCFLSEGDGIPNRFAQAFRVRKIRQFQPDLSEFTQGVTV